MSRQTLILGTPRSGTTWVYEVLAKAPGVTPVLEPDNEKVSFLGRWYKSHLPRFPTLQPGEEDSTYLALWNQAMYSPLGSWLATNRFLRTLEGLVINGEKLVLKKEQQALQQLNANQPVTVLRSVEGAFHEPVKRNATQRRVVKSVHGVFAAEWIAHKTRPDFTLIVQRMPHGILASMKKLAMGDAVRWGSLRRHLTAEELALLQEQGIRLGEPLNSQQLMAAGALQLAKMYAWFDELLRRHREWISVKHETLCEDPVERYRALFEKIELPWSAKIEAGIRERDRPGDGFAAVRKASDQIGKWKKSLSTAEIQLIDEIFLKQGLDHWTSCEQVAN
jgi:hypothetical protein